MTRPPEHLAQAIELAAANWPIGSLVWHRANGKRGLVVEYAVDGFAVCMIVVSWGASEPWDKCCAYELSLTQVSSGGDGEQWKEGSEPA